MNEFWILVRRLRRYWMVALLALFFIILTAFTEGFSVLLVIPLLEGLGQDTQSVAESNRLLSFINGLFADVPDDRLLQTAALVFVGMAVTRATVGMISTTLQAWLQFRLDRQLREEVFEQILNFSYEEMNQRRDSDWHLILNSETGRAARAVFGLVALTSDLFTITVYLGVLVAVSWQMTLVASGLLLTVLAILTGLVTLADRFGQRRYDDALAVQYGTMETVNAKRIVRIMQQQEYERLRYFRLVKRLQSAQLYLSIVTESSRQLLEVLVIGLLAVLLLIGGSVMDVDQTALIPLVSTFILMLYRMLPHVLSLNNKRTQISGDLASVRAVVELIEAGQQYFMPDGHLSFAGLKDSIRFENVQFQYAKRESPAILDLNLDLQRGETVALVGSSGAGKSTLADLLTRLYDPQQGRILIDGQDLRDLKLLDWRQNIGVVSQDTFIFNDTIGYNIGYGRKGCTQAEIEQAAQYANAHQFISDLPQGYNTRVGDRGVLLSGGQRQRIAIARAILRDPQILILDEATAALDSENERLIQAALDHLSKNRTSLVIAHRFSTILNADKIVVMEYGRVVEVGNHQELLAKEGRYALLYRTQFEPSEVGK